MKRILLALGAFLFLACGISTVQADIIAYTSFEEQDVFSSTQYADTGDAATDHALASNASQPVVNYTSIGGELGFSSYYTNTRDDVGLTDGDYVGVTNYTYNFSYTDGDQGFQMSDADGMMTLTLDTVDLTGYTDTSLSMDLFVGSTGWETTDVIRAYITTDSGSELDLLNTTGSDIDDLDIEGAWINLTEDLTGYSSATLSIELDSNAAYEAIYIDNIAFNGSTVPVPGAVWLLGSGLLAAVGLRRKKK